MRTILPSPLLRTALLADAAVSGIVGLMQVSGAKAMSEVTAIPHGLMLGTGLFLLAYAGLILYVARSPEAGWTLVATIIVGNMAWAMACMALLALDLIAPNGFGLLFVFVQVATVFSFAGLELVGLRASRDAVRVDVSSMDAEPSPSAR